MKINRREIEIKSPAKKLHERMHRKMHADGDWIQGAIKKPGALHRELGIPEGKKIPQKVLKKAEKSKNPTLSRRAHLAETLKGFHHGNK